MTGRPIVKNLKAVQHALGKTIAWKNPRLRAEAMTQAPAALRLRDAAIKELRVRRRVTERDKARVRRSAAGGDVAVAAYERSGYQVSAYTRSRPNR